MTWEANIVRSFALLDDGCLRVVQDTAAVWRARSGEDVYALYDVGSPAPGRSEFLMRPATDDPPGGCVYKVEGFDGRWELVEGDRRG